MEVLEKYMELKKSIKDTEKLYHEVYKKNELLALAGVGLDQMTILNSMIELRDSIQQLRYSMKVLMDTNNVFRVQLDSLIKSLRDGKCSADLAIYLVLNNKTLEVFAKEITDDQNIILELAEKIKELFLNRCKPTKEFAMEQFMSNI